MKRYTNAAQKGGICCDLPSHAEGHLSPHREGEDHLLCAAAYGKRITLVRRRKRTSPFLLFISPQRLLLEWLTRLPGSPLFRTIESVYVQAQKSMDRIRRLHFLHRQAA